MADAEAAIIDPSLFSATPFRNPTAWADLTGQIDFYHKVITDSISRILGVPCLKLPLGDGKLNDPTWLDALTRQHQAECTALVIAGPPSFSEYNLRDPGEFASFTFQVSQDLQRIRLAAGVA